MTEQKLCKNCGHEKELEMWTKKVFFLHYLEHIIKIQFESGKLKKRGHDALKNDLNKFWIGIWKTHPDTNMDIQKLFEKYFSDCGGWKE